MGRSRLSVVCALFVLFQMQNSKADDVANADSVEVELSTVPEELKTSAFQYFQAHAGSFPNKKYISMIDMSAHSSTPRWYLYETASGRVFRHKTMHGARSDLNNDGFAEHFSNEIDSNETSLGGYKTLETYYGGNGFSLRLDGLDSTNSNARRRYIVVHGDDSVHDEPNDTPNVSGGCPAVDRKYVKDLISKIKGGSLIYIWHPQAWNHE